MPLKYSHSGKYLGYAPLAGFLAGVAAGLPLAFVHVCLTVHLFPIPWGSGIYTALWMTMWRSISAAAFGVCAGLAAGLGLRWVKARNVKMAALVGLAVGLSVLYFAWMLRVYAYLARAQGWASLPSSLADPGELWRLIRTLHAAATAGSSAWSFHSVSLWLWWSAEGLIIAGMAAIVSAGDNAGTPFCESCDEWCREEELPGRLAAADPKEVKRRVEAKDFAYLEGLGSADPQDASWLRLTLHACPRCAATSALKVATVAQKGGAGSGESENSKVVVELIKLSANEAELVRKVASKVRLTADQEQWLKERTQRRLAAHKRNVRAIAIVMGILGFFGLGLSSAFEEYYAWLVFPQRIASVLLMACAVGIRFDLEMARKAACVILAAEMLVTGAYFVWYFLRKPDSDFSLGLLMAIAFMGGLLSYFSGENTKKLFERPDPASPTGISPEDAEQAKDGEPSEMSLTVFIVCLALAVFASMFFSVTHGNLFAAGVGLASTALVTGLALGVEALFKPAGLSRVNILLFFAMTWGMIFIVFCIFHPRGLWLMAGGFLIFWLAAFIFGVLARRAAARKEGE